MNWKSGPSVAYAETKARSSCSKSATASGRTRGSKHLNAHSGRRQSSSRECAACSWPRLAFRPASQPPMKSWRSACIDEAFPWSRSTRAILLGCARKYVAMLNAGTRTPITSLQYFADIVEEVNESAIPESYWEPLRCEGGANGTTVAAGPSSKALMPQPVGQPPAAPHHAIGPHHECCPHETECCPHPTESTPPPESEKRNDATWIFYLPFS